jgi:cytochrome c oxidase assembly protein subunit 15
MAYYGARVAHRYIASILGVFILVIFVLALRKGGNHTTNLLIPSAIFAITVFLSVLGYYTPTRSNPLVTMGNLLGGMALLGLLWWLLQREIEGTVLPPGPVNLRTPAALALGLVAVQIVLGGWSSANYASASCPGLISCEGGMPRAEHVADAFNPLRSIALDERGKVVRADSLAVLSMAHRLFALLTAGYLAWLVRRLRCVPTLKGTMIALSLFSIGQVAVGIGTVWFHMPLTLLTLHNCMAAGLLLSCINLLHRLVPPAVSRPPG